MNKHNLKPNHKPIFDFYFCLNDICSYLGQHEKRAAGDENMKVDTIPEGLHQGHPLCKWCSQEMVIAHNEEISIPPHIEWDGVSSVQGKYYQLKF